jgi:hypothetical protein
MRPFRAADLEGLAADIGARLRATCANLSEEEFAELVLDIAVMSRRFAEIDADPTLWHTVEPTRPIAPLPAAYTRGDQSACA